MLTPKKLIQLLQHGQVHLSNADAIVLGFSEDTLSIVCVDNSTLSDANQSTCVFSHIFIGPDTLDISVISSYNLPDVGVNIFAGPMKYSDIKSKHPASVFLVDPLFHPCVINEKEIHCLVNAVANKGSFPRRGIECSPRQC